MPRKNKGFDLFFLEKGPERRLKCTGVNMVCVSTVALTQRSVLVCACVCVCVCVRVTRMKILKFFNRILTTIITFRIEPLFEIFPSSPD